MGTLLLTGATGSFGQHFIERALAGRWFGRIVAFSDAESNQTTMRRRFPPSARLEYFIGNVRDYDRLRWAFRAGVDTVIHAAAMKEVPTCEYDWPEAVATNVEGSRNVALAAVECGVQRALLISTDKAAEAYTEYGKTKAMAESWFVRTNIRSHGTTRLSVVRYGNCLGSRASVVPAWMEQLAAHKPISITDARMTRFWWSLDTAVPFVASVLERMRGGEIWVPKMARAPIVDLAAALGATTQQYELVGIRGKEKLHEVMVTCDEARDTYETSDAYVILPPEPTWPLGPPEGARLVPDMFEYQSALKPYATKIELMALLGVAEQALK